MPLRRVHERPFGFHSRYLSPGGHVYLDGYWQSEQFFPQLRELLQAHFQPVSPLRSPSVEIALQMQRLQSVSLHVRRTDYVNNPIVVKIHGAVAHVLPDLRGSSAGAIRGPPPLRVLRRPPLVQTKSATLLPNDTLRILRPSRGIRRYVVNDPLSAPHCGQQQLQLVGRWLAQDQSGVVYAPQQWFQDATKDSRWIIPATWEKVASPEVSHLRAA